MKDLNKMVVGYGNRCFNVVEANGDEIEIDSNILNEIIMLNEKGYETKYSCGGHTEVDQYGMYVSFKINHNFKTLPNGWSENKNTINYKEKKRKVDIDYQVALDNFKEWVKQLPQLI